MAGFADLYSELVGLQPALSPFLAQKYINRAWRDIRDAREWSFLVAEGSFNAPSLVQTGAVALTQNATTITFNSAAQAVLNPLVTATPVITLYQFRVSAAGALYNVVAYDSTTGIMTLDRALLEATNPNSTYMLYQAYFPPPPQAIQGNMLYDFDRWISVLDPVNGISLTIDTDKKWLDWYDPQRTISDLAYGIYDYKTNQYGTPFYEFWPHPTAGQQFVCQYRRQGLDFSLGTQQLPQYVPEALIINRALYRYVYPWCIQQAGRQPALAKVNWTALIRESRDDYNKDLQSAKMQDENVHLTAIVSPQGYPGYDSKFIQSHDMAFFSRRG